MSSKINAKLGLKPQTRVRQATHGSALATAIVCPACARRHCLIVQSTNGKRLGTHWCGSCSTFFTPATQSVEARAA